MSRRVVCAIAVVVALCVACTPPQVQRPLDGAQPNAAGQSATGSGASANVPPTLSAATPVTGASPDPAVAAPSPSPSPEPGYVIVGTDGRGANLREGPGLGTRVITTLAEGTPIEIFDETATADGRPWRRIRGGNREGWVVAPVVRRR